MEKNKNQSSQQIRNSMNAACDIQYDLLDNNVLCLSIGTMPPKAAVIASQNDTLDSVLNLLQAQKTGCVIVVDDNNQTVGIFTERDYILKVARSYFEYKDQPISTFMTKDPVVQTLDCTIAYALTLMSEGGFRNLPIVDEENIPVGIIAVKDLVDFIVGNFMNKLLSFPVEP